MIHQTYWASGSTRVVTARSMPMRTRLGICTCTISPAKDSSSEVTSNPRWAVTSGRASRNQLSRTSGWMDALGARRVNGPPGYHEVFSLANNTPWPRPRERDENHRRSAHAVRLRIDRLAGGVRGWRGQRDQVVVDEPAHAPGLVVHHVTPAAVAQQHRPRTQLP